MASAPPADKQTALARAIAAVLKEELAGADGPFGAVMAALAALTVQTGALEARVECLSNVTRSEATPAPKRAIRTAAADPVAPAAETPGPAKKRAAGARAKVASEKPAVAINALLFFREALRNDEGGYRAAHASPEQAAAVEATLGEAALKSLGTAKGKGEGDYFYTLGQHLWKVMSPEDKLAIGATHKQAKAAASESSAEPQLECEELV